MKIKAGQMVKVINSYASGSRVEVQGRAREPYDSGLSNTIRIEGYRENFIEVWGYSGNGAAVTIELIPEPLPEALGSVIRYFYEGPEKREEYQIQIRVPDQRRNHTDADDVVLSWMTGEGTMVADPKGYYEILFDPEATGD